MIDCFLLPLWKSPRKPREKGDKKKRKINGERKCTLRENVTRNKNLKNRIKEAWGKDILIKTSKSPLAEQQLCC